MTDYIRWTWLIASDEHDRLHQMNMTDYSRWTGLITSDEHDWLHQINMTDYIRSTWLITQIHMMILIWTKTPPLQFRCLNRHVASCLNRHVASCLNRHVASCLNRHVTSCTTLWIEKHVKHAWMRKRPSKPSNNTTSTVLGKPLLIAEKKIHCFAQYSSLERWPKKYNGIAFFLFPKLKRRLEDCKSLDQSMWLTAWSNFKSTLVVYPCQRELMQSRRNHGSVYWNGVFVLQLELWGSPHRWKFWRCDFLATAKVAIQIASLDFSTNFVNLCF